MEIIFKILLITGFLQEDLKNASEVVRADLRLLEEEEETKLINLKKAFGEGIESGIAKHFNPKKHLESLKAQKA